MIRTLIWLMLSLWLMAPARGERVYVRNRPCAGETSGRGQELMISLKDLAAGLDLNVEESDGHFAIGPAPVEARAGEVYVQGVKVTSQAGQSGPLVRLKEFADAAGLLYRVNPELDSIDVFPRPRGAAPSSSSSGAAGIIQVNEKTPGADVSYMSLLVRGKINMVCFYTYQLKDKGYLRCASAVDVFARFGDVHLVKINVGDPDHSPVRQRYPGMVPRVEIYGPTLHSAWQWNGLCILDYCARPEEALARMRTFR